MLVSLLTQSAHYCKKLVQMFLNSGCSLDCTYWYIIDSWTKSSWAADSLGGLHAAHVFEVGLYRIVILSIRLNNK